MYIGMQFVIDEIQLIPNSRGENNTTQQSRVTLINTHDKNLYLINIFKDKIHN